MAGQPSLWDEATPEPRTVVMVFGDIFRSHDLSGGAKTLWTLFVIFLPFLGVLAYLTLRGDRIAEHRMADAQRADQAMQAYIRSSTATPADDLGKLVDLHDRDIVDDAEFESMRQRLVSS